MAAKLTIGLLVGSVIALAAGATRGGVGARLLLSPQDMLGKLALWQPFTYGFVELDPLGIIFGAFILYSIGGGLEMTWGSRRLLSVLWGGTVLAGLLTFLLAFVFPMNAFYTGGGVMTTLAWVAYGLSIGRGQSNFWGIPISGNVLAGIGVGFVVLNGLRAGWSSQVPQLFAILIAFVYVNGGSPRHLMLRLQHWRLQRQLRGRSRHLKVLSEEKNRPDDRYLN
jgi:hypothetical protein